MNGKKYMGTYYSTDNVLAKITQLIANGYDENHIYAVTYEQDNVAELEGQTSVEISATGAGDWISRLKVFLSGEEPGYHAFKQIGLSGEEAQKYFDEVKDGGVALFVDEVLERMDSQADVNRHGESLSNQEEYEDVTTPRTNTENL